MTKLLQYPDSLLLKVSEKVDKQREGQQLADELRRTCSETEWGVAAGMAAPQIGILKRVFVTDFGVFINPEVIWLPTTGWRWFNEGCYSLDRDRYDYRVYRPWSITLKWTDYAGAPQWENFFGDKAQIVHHEYEHLGGLLVNRNELQKNTK